jgi:hypothetical protein
MDEIFLQKIKTAGLNYRSYFDLIKKEVENGIQNNSHDEEKKRFEDRKLNLHRMTRIEKHYVVSEELKEMINKINSPQTWMIISETWCGDSAQNIPFIAKISDSNLQIDLRIILRDSNPDIMDLYLTNGTRSIPIMVAFDGNGRELFRWGPRPEEAKKLFADLKSQGMEKSIILEKLHLWYGRNRGAALESELKKLIIIKQ